MILYHDDYPFDNPQPTRFTPNRFLISALFISLGLHAVLLWLMPDWRLWKPQESRSTSMQISLQTLVEKKILPVEETKPLLEQPQPKVEEKPQAVVTPKAEKILTTSGETQNIIEQPVEFLSVDEIRQLSQDPPEMSTNDSLAFNHRLREARANTPSVPNSSATKGQLEAWQDIHGNRFYKSGSQCYKAVSEARGVSSTEKGTNWYAVGCSGKSESEKITDRINEEMQQRFSQ